jgi:BirA family transcriptional regulator, biotin operon repressor / biotin---[acetyl-CoA-carboxylase] ligase
VVGIGINVNHSQMPAELKEIATSLRIETRRPWSRVHLFVALLKELEKHYHLLLEDGSAAITERWSAVSSFAYGKRVRVVSNHGEFLASTLGLEPSGALRVQREDGQIEALVGGEVTEVK